jgi:DNA-directed RNA polymerase II subunit RPB2
MVQHKDEVVESALSLLTDTTVKNILESHSHVHGYADFQKRSYEHFLDELLPHIVEEHSQIVYDSKTTHQRHVVTLGQLTMAKPNHREADGKVCMLLPEEARLRQLDYSIPVLVDVRHQVFSLNTEASTSTSTVPPPGAPSAVAAAAAVAPASVAPLILVQDHLYREVPFCELPMMLQTRHCHLYSTSRVPSVSNAWDGSTEKRPLAECPYDEGGYFVIRGIERGLQVQEGMRTNLPVISPVKQPNKYSFVCEVRSRHESKMRSTSTLRIFITTKKGGAAPEIFLAMPFLPSLDVPLIMVLRLLQDVPDHQTFISLIVPELAGGGGGGGGGGDTSAGPGAALVGAVREVLAHTSNGMSIEQLYDYIGREGTRESTSEAKRRYVEHLMANELLPHLGYNNGSRDTAFKKIVYLCLIVRRLITAYCATPAGFSGSEEEGRAIPEVDDRDHYANKRLSLSGTMIALLFRQLMRQFVKNMRRYMYITIENRRYMNLPDAVNNRKISAALRFAFRTGNWSTQRTSGTHVGVTQVILRMSHIALQSQIRRVNTPICREGKATHVRQAHVSHWGIVCPSETPEGTGCGLVKNLAVLTHVRIGVPSALICSVLYAHLGVVKFDHVLHAAPRFTRLLVFVNGDIVGVHPSPEVLVRDARLARRTLNLPFDTSVVSHPQGGVSLHTDTGCCLRPVLVVERLRLLVGALEHARDNPGVEVWNVLVQRGIIEYVDKDEERELRVAVTVAELRHELRQPPPDSSSNDGGGATGAYTHLEIHPTSILGHCTMQIPYADRNQAPRNIYQVRITSGAGWCGAGLTIACACLPAPGGVCVPTRSGQHGQTGGGGAVTRVQ